MCIRMYKHTQGDNGTVGPKKKEEKKKEYSIPPSHETVTSTHRAYHFQFDGRFHFWPWIQPIPYIPYHYSVLSVCPCHFYLSHFVNKRSNNNHSSSAASRPGNRKTAEIKSDTLCTHEKIVRPKLVESMLLLTLCESIIVRNARKLTLYKHSHLHISTLTASVPYDFK